MNLYHNVRKQVGIGYSLRNIGSRNFLGKNLSDAALFVEEMSGAIMVAFLMFLHHT